MYTELCDVGEDNGKVNVGKPKYILMDVTVSHHLNDNSVIILYNTNIKSNFFSSKKIIILLAILVAFAIGFALGNLTPLHLTAKEIGSIAESSKVNNLKQVTVNSRSLVPDSLAKNNNIFVHNKYVDGIFWSEYVEKLLPREFGIEEGLEWKEFVERSAIVRIEDGCGRMQNRMVVFADGTKACCRYRPNTDQIQGEIFSYHLGRLLGLGNMVPSALAVVNKSETLWQAVAADIDLAQWAEGRPVVITRYVDDLSPANIPEALQNVLSTVSTQKTLKPVDVRKTVDLDLVRTDRDAVELAQWSDLIVFDYLTANLDRVVNNLYNLQWNRNMLDSPTHNLARTTSKLLVFLDNESGLLHGYRLLSKYEPYHSLLLEGICVFRRSTVDALANLRSRGIHLPTSPVLPSLPDKNVDILQQRLDQILRQVLSCVRRGR